MSVAEAQRVIDSMRTSIEDVKRCGGNVNRISTTPAIKRALIRHLGGAPDSALIIDKAHVIADETMPPGAVSFTWWEA